MRGVGLGIGGIESRGRNSLARGLLSEATFINETSGAFTNASGNRWDPYNKAFVGVNARRRRPLVRIPGKTYYGDLLFPSRTNSFLSSQDLNNPNWTKTDTTITTGALRAPDGTLSLDLCTDGTLGTAKIQQSVTITAGRVCVMSGVFARGNNDWIRLSFEAGTDACRCWFNLATGVAGTVSNVGTSSGTASGILPLGGGLFLVWVSGVMNAAGTSAGANVLCCDADASNTRVSGATRYQGWMQFEVMVAGATTGFPSPYNPTTSATITCSADSLLMNYVLGQSGTIISLLLPYLWSGNPDGSALVRELNCDDTSNSRMVVAVAGNTMSSTRIDAGGTRTSSSSITPAANTLVHHAMSWDGAGVTSLVNGVAASTTAIVTPPWNTNVTARIGGQSATLGIVCAWQAAFGWSRKLSTSETLAFYNAFRAAA